MALLTNLVSYWKLDESSGNAIDSISGFTGTNTSVTYGAGKIRNGAVMDGVASKFVITDVSALKITGQFSVQAWFKGTSTDSIIYESYSGNPNVAGYRLETNDVGGVGKATVLSGKNTGTTLGTDYQFINGSTTVTDGAWHHMVGVYNGTNLIIYVDGASNGSVAWANNPAFAATNYIRIGCRNASGTDGNFVNGTIDEVAVWSRAITAAEVSQLYNGGSGLQYPFYSQNFLIFFNK